MCAVTSSDPQPAAAKTRVYIVDDRPGIRRELAALIADQPDMEVCGEAAHGAALRHVLTLQPDVAVVDSSLASDSGLELVSNIRAFNVNIRTCVFSACDEFVSAIRAFKAGAHGYVLKRDEPERILDGLRRVSRSEFFVSVNVHEAARSD
jgi:two-component system, NarL family, response regulator FusR